MDLQQPLYL